MPDPVIAFSLANETRSIERLCAPVLLAFPLFCHHFCHRISYIRITEKLRDKINRICKDKEQPSEHLEFTFMVDKHTQVFLLRDCPCPFWAPLSTTIISPKRERSIEITSLPRFLYRGSWSFANEKALPVYRSFLTITGAPVNLKPEHKVSRIHLSLYEFIIPLIVH